MDVNTLNIAIILNKEIVDLQNALLCFNKHIELGGASNNPKLLIEFDDGEERTVLELPMVLCNTLIDLIKFNIVQARNEAVAKFNVL